MSGSVGQRFWAGSNACLPNHALCHCATQLGAAAPQLGPFLGPGRIPQIFFAILGKRGTQPTPNERPVNRISQLDKIETSPVAVAGIRKKQIMAPSRAGPVGLRRLLLLTSSRTTSSLGWGVGRAVTVTRTTAGVRRMQGAACAEGWEWGKPLQAHAARRQKVGSVAALTQPVPTPTILLPAARGDTHLHRGFRTFATSSRDEATQPPPRQSDAGTATVPDPELELPQPPEYLSPAELAVFEKLRNGLEPVALEVQDISGGCGSMYGIDITSPRFKGKNVVAMHRMVNEVLKEELKGWHGVQLKTRAA